MVQELGAEPQSVVPIPDTNPSVTDGDSLQWTAEALSRLDRIPEFVRPMAKQGIEHWARDHGCDRVTEEVLERARGTMGMSS
ncbi:MAG: PCP reductase family protein [Thermoanaerobaculia bacterium]|nr:PCP reductase family protein [Thermoanaerobaculia bacterium]